MPAGQPGTIAARLAVYRMVRLHQGQLNKDHVVLKLPAFGSAGLGSQFGCIYVWFWSLVELYVIFRNAAYPLSAIMIRQSVLVSPSYLKRSEHIKIPGCSSDSVVALANVLTAPNR